MDQIALSVTSAVHALEEVRLPAVPFNSFIKGVVLGIPVCVFLHDTADYWLNPEAPENKFKFLRKVPVVGNIINFFLHSWRENPENKKIHLMVVRNIIMMAFFIVLNTDPSANEPTEPYQYLEGKVMSPAATSSFNQEIYKNRNRAFTMADGVIGEEESNFVAVQQQRDAALRRRYMKKN